MKKIIKCFLNLVLLLITFFLLVSCGLLKGGAIKQSSIIEIDQEDGLTRVVVDEYTNIANNYAGGRRSKMSD